MSRMRVPITPEVLRWARRKSGYNIEDAASRIGRPIEELQAWEAGELQPSLAQARKSAEVYKRPLAVFFLPEPPRDFDTLRDFRKLPKGASREYSPQLCLIIRRLQNRQKWLSDYLKSEGFPTHKFIGSATLNSDPVQLGTKIRSTLKIRMEDVFKCKSREEALRLWIDHTEETGIFVCQTGNLKYEKIGVEEARGASLADKYAPFIFLNAQDAKAAQIFTLAHELIHLWLNEPGLSNLVSPKEPSTDTENIEVFCNKIAAEILVPNSIFLESLLSLSDESVEHKITSLSVKFRVSQEVIARRMLDSGKINNKLYQSLADKYRRELLDLKKQEKKEARQKEGWPHPCLLKLINNGRAFTQTVISAYKSGDITGITASNLLEMKLNHFPTVADMLHLPLTGRRTVL